MHQSESSGVLICTKPFNSQDPLSTLENMTCTAKLTPTSAKPQEHTSGAPNHADELQPTNVQAVANYLDITEVKQLLQLIFMNFTKWYNRLLFVF